MESTTLKSSPPQGVDIDSMSEAWALFRQTGELKSGPNPEMP